MAETDGDKTEAPTPRRRAEARDQGNLARSQDLTLALLLIGVMVMLHTGGPKLVTALKSLVQETLGGSSMSDTSGQGALGGTLHAILTAGAAMAPLLVGVVLIATLANVVQV